MASCAGPNARALSARAWSARTSWIQSTTLTNKPKSPATEPAMGATGCVRSREEMVLAVRLEKTKYDLNLFYLFLLMKYFL
jgi:hypothetical protein